MTRPSSSKNHTATTEKPITSTNPPPPPPPPHPPPATQACAACKHQRRRCLPDCTLAPYFPADKQPQFSNAHRLFGVSNILKMVRPLDRRSRDVAMSTIMFQADARAIDPVGGCYRIVLDLQREIDILSLELSLVLQKLEECRNRQQFGCLYNGDEGVGGFGNALEMEMLGFQQQKGEGEMEDLKPMIDVFDVTGGDEVKEEEVVMDRAVAGEGNGFCFSFKAQLFGTNVPNQQKGAGEMEILKLKVDVFDVMGGEEVEEVVMDKVIASERNGFCFWFVLRIPLSWV